MQNEYKLEACQKYYYKINMIQNYIKKIKSRVSRNENEERDYFIK